MCHRDVGLDAHTQRVMNLSLACDNPGAHQAVEPRPFARRAVWGALLLVEGLVLSVLYDPTPYFGNHRWWATLLAQGPRCSAAWSSSPSWPPL